MHACGGLVPRGAWSINQSTNQSYKSIDDDDRPGPNPPANRHFLPPPTTYKGCALTCEDSIASSAGAAPKLKACNKMCYQRCECLPDHLLLEVSLRWPSCVYMYKQQNGPKHPTIPTPFPPNPAHDRATACPRPPATACGTQGPPGGNARCVSRLFVGLHPEPNRSARTLSSSPLRALFSSFSHADQILSPPPPPHTHIHKRVSSRSQAIEEALEEFDPDRDQLLPPKSDGGRSRPRPRPGTAVGGQSDVFDDVNDFLGRAVAGRWGRGGGGGGGAGE